MPCSPFPYWLFIFYISECCCGNSSPWDTHSMPGCVGLGLSLGHCPIHDAPQQASMPFAFSSFPLCVWRFLHLLILWVPVHESIYCSCLAEFWYLHNVLYFFYITDETMLMLVQTVIPDMYL